MFNFIFRVERWKFNKDYGVWVSSEGNFKDRYKRPLPIKINSGGYYSVYTEKGYKTARRLVMLTFKPIPDSESLTVDHLNHNKRDNSLKNLEWVSKGENLRRAREDTLVDNKVKHKYFLINNKIYEYNEALSLFLALEPNTSQFKNSIEKKLNNIYKNNVSTVYYRLPIRPFDEEENKNENY